MPRGITQEQVDQAADAIVATGERPTVDKVRNRLGTGSPNTVTRMLDAWRQGLAERLRQVQLLPALPEPVGQAMTALWTQALDHARGQARSELDAEREALHHATAALDAREAEQVNAATALQAAQAKAEESARLATARADAQQRLIERLEADAQQQAQDRQRLVTDIETASASEAELRRRIDTLEATATHEREHVQRHVHSVEDRAHAQVDRARTDLKAARAELAEVRHQLREDQRTHQRQIDDLRVALSRAEREASRQRGIAEALKPMRNRAATAKREQSGRRKPASKPPVKPRQRKR